MKKRVGVAGIHHESNTFIGEPTTLEQFRKGHWLTGEDIRKEYRDAWHELGGMFEVMEEEGIEVVPLLFAAATPGGAVANDAYAVLLHGLMVELEKAGPLDGCLVAPHGAGVAPAFPDLDGHWLAALRARLGAETPVIGTLDPHGNLSPRMAAATDALIAYKTNPHIDQRERGREAARLMARTLRGECRPVQALVQLPLAINIERQGTDSEPCRRLYLEAAALNRREGVLAVSILLGFPYADVEEMGTAVLVVADRDRSLAAAVAKQLADSIVGSHEEFLGPEQDIGMQIASLAGMERPVLLLDMGDNVGAGAPGNSCFLMRKIEEQVEGMTYFACIQDPAMVVRAGAVGVGAELELAIEDAGGGYRGRGRVLRLADGRFSEAAPRHGGQVHFDMGRIAVVRTVSGHTILFTTLRTAPFSLRQLTGFGIDPAAFDILIAKGVHAPVAAYGPVCRTILRVDTPGVTQADMTKFEFHHRRKPMFPWENIERRVYAH